MRTGTCIDIGAIAFAVTVPHLCISCGRRQRAGNCTLLSPRWVWAHSQGIYLDQTCRRCSSILHSCRRYPNVHQKLAECLYQLHGIMCMQQACMAANPSSRGKHASEDFRLALQQRHIAAVQNRGLLLEALLCSPRESWLDNLWMFQTEMKMSEPAATWKPPRTSSWMARLIRTGGCGYSRIASLMTRVVKRSCFMSSSSGVRSPTTASTCTGARSTGLLEKHDKGSMHRQPPHHTSPHLHATAQEKVTVTGTKAAAPAQLSDGWPKSSIGAHIGSRA